MVYRALSVAITAFLLNGYVQAESLSTTNLINPLFLNGAGSSGAVLDVSSYVDAEKFQITSAVLSLRLYGLGPASTPPPYELGDMVQTGAGVDYYGNPWSTYDSHVYVQDALESGFVQVGAPSSPLIGFSDKATSYSVTKLTYSQPVVVAVGWEPTPPGQWTHFDNMIYDTVGYLNYYQHVEGYSGAFGFDVQVDAAGIKLLNGVQKIPLMFTSIGGDGLVLESAAMRLEYTSAVPEADGYLLALAGLGVVAFARSLVSSKTRDE